MNLLQKTIIISVFVAVLLPLGASAQEPRTIDYKPISVVPGVIDQTSIGTGGVENYLSRMFDFAIGIGALLAVVQIAIAGIKWMTSSAVGTITQARSQIRDAILGLLLLLSTWIILNEINSNLTTFKIGQDSSSVVNSESTASVVNQ